MSAYISEQQMIDIGFNRLLNGTLVMVDIFGTEVVDIIAATRIRNLREDVELGGYMVSGFDFADYFDDIEKVKKILSIK